MSQVATTIAGIQNTIGNKIINKNSQPQYCQVTVITGQNSSDDVLHDRKMEPLPVDFGHKSFGFLPTSPLQIYTGDPVYWENMPDLIKVHKLIQETRLPNLLKCPIPVQSALNELESFFMQLLGSADMCFITLWLPSRF